MSDDRDSAGAHRPEPPEALVARVRELRAELRRREAEIECLETIVAGQRHMLELIQGSFAWQLVRRLRHARDRVAARVDRLGLGRRSAVLDRLLRRPSGSPVPRETPAEAYARWVARHGVTASDIQAMSVEARRLPTRPLLSVVVDARGAGGAGLRRCLASIRDQVWDRWEVVALSDGAEPDPVVRALAEAASDARVRLERVAHSSGAIGAGVPAARGDLVGFVGATDALAPEALYEVALAIEATPDADLVYSDEDAIDDGGERSAPFFKPDWSPDLLLSMNYVGQLAMFRRELVSDLTIGDGTSGADPHYDAVLGCSEKARRVVHLPAMLYHAARARRPDVGASIAAVLEAERRAVEGALRRRKIEAHVEQGPRRVFRVRYAVKGNPLVSIIMPTKDKAQVLRTCVESIDTRSTWKHRELLVVDNGSAERAAVRYLLELERRHRVLRDARPFNWSAINNAAAREARGEHLLFMNNDMEVIAPDWIEALLEHAQRPEVGAVGAKLLYPDRTLQHAGVVLGLGIAGHAFKYLPDADPSYACLAHAVRDVSAVTGACMMVRRDVFDRIGGFDERLPVAYNDIDFCLRLRDAGLRVLYTPFATLVHHESATRGSLSPPKDEALIWQRWRAALARDPYYSPHLTREREDYTIG